MADSTIFIHAETSGQGQTVVFIHGFLESNFMWRNILPHFNEHHCISLEIFGHGQSSFSKTETPNIHWLQRQISEKLSALDVKDFSVIGHSLGGYLGLELLANDSRLKHLVLLNSHPWGDTSDKKKDRTRVSEFVLSKKELFISEAIPNLFYQKTEIVIEYLNIASRIGSEVISWHSRMMRDRESKVDLILKNRQKITLIQGEKDHLIPVNDMKNFCIQNSLNYHEIKNAGHMIHEEKTQELLDILSTIYSLNGVDH
jgi:pimeloyl-ACP methyl ester carboxylesterase